MNGLLTAVVPEGGRVIGVGEAAMYAGIGMVVVFLGIAFLVFFVWLVGALLNHLPKKADKGEAITPERHASDETNEVDDETVTIITAAIAAYYQAQPVSCGFIIKKIKRNR